MWQHPQRNMAHLNSSWRGLYQQQWTVVDMRRGEVHVMAKKLARDTRFIIKKWTNTETASANIFLWKLYRHLLSCFVCCWQSFGLLLFYLDTGHSLVLCVYSPRSIKIPTLIPRDLNHRPQSRWLKWGHSVYLKVRITAQNYSKPTGLTLPLLIGHLSQDRCVATMCRCPVLAVSLAGCKLFNRMPELSRDSKQLNPEIGPLNRRLELQPLLQWTMGLGRMNDWVRSLSIAVEETEEREDEEE